MKLNAENTIFAYTLTTVVTQGLEREDALIELLCVNLDRRWEQEIILASPNEDGSPAWIAHRDAIIDEIKMLRERKRAIAADIDAIFKRDFWEIRSIERPPRLDIDPEGYPTIYEQAIEKIEANDPVRRSKTPTNRTNNASPWPVYQVYPRPELSKCVIHDCSGSLKKPIDIKPGPVRLQEPDLLSSGRGVSWNGLYPAMLPHPRHVNAIRKFGPIFLARFSLAGKQRNW